jgi:hypothetical protein
MNTTASLMVGPGPVAGAITSGVHGVANDNCVFLTTSDVNTSRILVRSVNATLTWSALTPLAKLMSLVVSNSPANGLISTYHTDFGQSPQAVSLRDPFQNTKVHTMTVGARPETPPQGAEVAQPATLTVRVEFAYTGEAPRFNVGTC